MKNMEMSRKLEKYQELLLLQEKVRKGIIKKEDLSYRDLIMICRLYDMQTEEIYKTNDELKNKIIEYKKKIS